MLQYIYNRRKMPETDRKRNEYVIKFYIKHMLVFRRWANEAAQILGLGRCHLYGDGDDYRSST